MQISGPRLPPPSFSRLARPLPPTEKFISVDEGRAPSQQVREPLCTSKASSSLGFRAEMPSRNPSVDEDGEGRGAQLTPTPGKDDLVACLGTSHQRRAKWARGRQGLRRVCGTPRGCTPKVHGFPSAPEVLRGTSGLWAKTRATLPPGGFQPPAPRVPGRGAASREAEPRGR